MKRVIFIANIYINEVEGIYKKVCAESRAIAMLKGRCDLILRDGKKTRIIEFPNENNYCINEGIFKVVNEMVKNNEIEMMYIRHMIPSVSLIRAIYLAKKNHVKLFYEIPTYPYFGEQIKASVNKFRAIAKIVLDIVFWPWIYFFVDCLFVICSNSNVHRFKKMVEITNGMDTSNLVGKNYSLQKDEKIFRLVAIGTIYPYHGYDRVLRGLAICNECIDNTIVELHIIGSSNTIDELQRLSNKLELKHVFFHGKKTTEELNQMCDMFDMGLGCLALYRRNADIDTTLKVIEYYCRGIPVVSSGKCPYEENEFTFVVDNSSRPISIKDIYDFYNTIPKNKLIDLALCAKDRFSWISIFADKI